MVCTGIANVSMFPRDYVQVMSQELHVHVYTYTNIIIYGSWDKTFLSPFYFKYKHRINSTCP